MQLTLHFGSLASDSWAEPLHLAQTAFQRCCVPTTLSAWLWILTAGRQLRRGGNKSYCMSQGWMLRTEINNLSGAQRDYTPSHHICGLGLDLGLCKAGMVRTVACCKTAGLPRGESRHRLGQTFAVTRLTSTAQFLCCGWKCRGVAIQPGKLL